MTNPQYSWTSFWLKIGSCITGKLVKFRPQIPSKIPVHFKRTKKFLSKSRENSEKTEPKWARKNRRPEMCVLPNNNRKHSSRGSLATRGRLCSLGDGCVWNYSTTRIDSKTSRRLEGRMSRRRDPNKQSDRLEAAANTVRRMRWGNASSSLLLLVLDSVRLVEFRLLF